MKTIRRHIVIASACLLILITGSSCNFFRNLFGPKYGCPSNGKNVGAERILSGEKVPKAKKFKAWQRFLSRTILLTLIHSLWASRYVPILAAPKPL